MKKLVKILFLGIIVSITSCNSNDTSTSITEADLIGTWSLTEFRTENGSFTGTQNGISVTGSYEATGASFNSSIIFSNNPNTTVASGSFTVNSSVTVLGQTETFQETIDNVPNIGGSWALTGDVLSFTEQGETASAEIISFENNTLKLKTVINRDVNLDGTGNASMTGEVYITLTK